MAGLKAQLAHATPAQPTVNHSRRRALKRFATLLLGGAVVSAFASPPALEAKIISNPQGHSNRNGAIIQSPPAQPIPIAPPASLSLA